MIENHMLSIILAYLIADNRIITASQTRRELEMHLFVIHLIHLDRYNFLQLLDATLHLYRLSRFISESLYKVLNISDFLLLVLVSPQLLFTTFLAKYDILIVFHFVVLYPSAGNLQRTIGNIIDKRTVVAHEYYRLGTLSKKLFQPLDTFDIKMVGRLIEQKDIRFLQQDFRQFNTHTPSTGKLSGRTFKILSHKSETCQGTFDFSLIVFTSHHHVAFMLLRELLHELRIFITLVVGTVSHLLLHLIKTRLHLRIMSKGLAGFFLDRRIVLKFHDLRQISDSGIVWNRHNTVSRFLQTTQDFEHGRFSSTVFADERYAISIIDDKTDIMKKRFNAKFNFKIFNRYHYRIYILQNLDYRIYF